MGEWLSAVSVAQFPNVILGSPYRRAVETLDIAFSVLKRAQRRAPAVSVDHRLRDRDTGMLELQTTAAGRRVMVLAHDAVVLMLRHIIEGLAAQDLLLVMRSGPVHNASATHWFARDGGLHLAYYKKVVGRRTAGMEGFVDGR